MTSIPSPKKTPGSLTRYDLTASWVRRMCAAIGISFRRRLAALLPVVLFPFAALQAQSNYATPYTFTTLAGTAAIGSADGTGSAARFNFPHSVAVDGAGNVYVADNGNNTIRKITPEGVVTTLAGSAGSTGSTDGAGSAALFDNPLGVAVDGVGNVYVADSGNNTVRKITPAGVVTTIAGTAGTHGLIDGTGGAARFYFPTGVAVDGAGNVYVADTLFNNAIRKITPAGVVTTIASGSTAQLEYPYGVAVDGTGNVYVANTYNHTILKITSDGTISTLAGTASGTGSADGTGSAAQFNYPYGVAVDGVGNVYVADTLNNTIRRITPTGAVNTLAGTASSIGSADGTGGVARFSSPSGVAVDGVGNIYVADSQNHTIRKGVPALGIATQPTSQTIIPGQNASFTVVATGAASFGYQWRKGGVNLTGSGTVSGAASATLTITGVQANDAGSYDVVVTDMSTGSVTSAAATLTLRGQGTTGSQLVAVGAAGTILTSPEGRDWTSRASGTNLRLRAAAASGNLFVAVGEAGTILTSPTGATWTARSSGTPQTLRGVAASPSRFVAVGGYSAAAVLTSADGLSWSAATLPPGGGELRAVAWGNGVFVAVGAGGTVLTSTDGATWVAQNADTSARLDAVMWTGSQFYAVTEFGQKLVSADGSAWTAGSTATLPSWIESVAWSDTGYVVVGANGAIETSADGAFWVGAASGTTATIHGLAWSGALLTPAGDPVAQLSNLQNAPLIIAQPAAIGPVNAGGTAVFTVGASGSGVTYQWRRNGTAIAGAIAATLTINNVQAGDAGSYDIVMSNPAGSVISNAVTLTVDTTIPPTITGLSQTRQVLTPGQNLTLSVTATGPSPFTYQWTRNGRPIAGGTGATLPLSNVTYHDSGYYLVLVTNTNGTTRSAPIFVTVAPSVTEVREWTNGGVQFSTPAGLNNAIAVVGNSLTTVALKADSTVVGWGSNLYGQTTIPVGLTEVVAIALGAQHALALKANGTVVEWGTYAPGQTAMPAGLTDVVAIAAAYGRSFALKADGTVVGWGSSDAGAFPAGLANVVGIAAGGNFALAVKLDGTVAAWPSAMSYGQTTVPADLTNVVAVAGGVQHSLAVKADGTVVAWGTSGYAQPAVPAGLANVVAIAAGSDGFSLALKADGTVVEWYTYGEASVPVALDRVLAINLYGTHSIALADASPVSAPVITTQLSSQTIAEGQDAILAIAATGGRLNYQWWKNGGGVFNGHFISGATTGTLKIRDVRASDIGDYTVVVSNSAGSVTSNPATLNVDVLAPNQTINFPALADRPFTTTAITLSATASSGLPVTFQVSGPATLSGNSLTLTGLGTVWVWASQAGNGSYLAAPSVQRGFFVTGNFLWWQYSWFTAEELADPNISNPNAFYRPDGYPNLVKYALGLNTRQAVTTGLPAMSTTATDWVYTYTRPSNRPDITYAVEISTNLTTWTTVGVTHERVSFVNEFWETWQARYPLAAAANCYFRLKVTQP